MNSSHRSWLLWFELFRSRGGRPVPQVEISKLTEFQRRCLGRSLAIFQVGEAGEGRIARQIRSYKGARITTDYCVALGLFVAEEAHHARVLEALLDALGTNKLTTAWSDVVFTALRRLMGIRFKLLVLMAAEVVGLSFYEVVAGNLEPGPFPSALEQICEDEEDHLLFHADFFQSQLISALERVVFRLLWPVISLLALEVACFDHRHTFMALNVDHKAFMDRGRYLISQASAHCLSES
jgi:hypothetical protein